MNTYLKVVAYACLYKTQEEPVDGIKLDDITITLVREGKPQKLFQWFEENGYQINEKYKGIYYIDKEGFFPTQIVVSKQLSKESQKWLTLLSSDLDKTDAERAVVQVGELTSETEKEYADSVLKVTVKENKELFNEEDGMMFEAFRELMEPEMNKALAQNRKDIILGGLRNGSSAEEISKVMGIPLVEIKAVEEELF